MCGHIKHVGGTLTGCVFVLERPSLTAVLSCAVEKYTLVTFHNGFMFFLLRVGVSSTKHTHIHTHIHVQVRVRVVVCVCLCVGVGVCVCDCVCVECEWKEEEGRSGGGGGWVGRCVVFVVR